MDVHVEFVSFFPPRKAGIEWRLCQRTDVALELKFLLLASVLGEVPCPSSCLPFPLSSQKRKTEHPLLGIRDSQHSLRGLME